MNQLFESLGERISGETTELDKVVDRALESWARAGSASLDQAIFLDSVALNLHGVYSGLERLFEQIATHVDGSLPDTATWHRDLLTIQDVMGWLDYHLHEFQVINPKTKVLERIGIPSGEFESDREVKPGWRVAISDYFSPWSRLADYTYDFGDDWKHTVVFEDREVLDPSLDYPILLGGAHACPPEDVGGRHGYELFLEAIQDQSHPDHRDMLEWVGGSFDPTRFDPRDIRFDDAQERWKTAFE